MTTARIERETIAVVTHKVEEKVVLEMSMEQAKTLRIICGRIGGSPTDSRRGHIDEISAALYAAGLRIAANFDTRATLFTEGSKAQLHFADGSLDVAL